MRLSLKLGVTALFACLAFVSTEGVQASTRASANGLSNSDLALKTSMISTIEHSRANVLQGLPGEPSVKSEEVNKHVLLSTLSTFVFKAVEGKQVCFKVDYRF